MKSSFNRGRSPRKALVMIEPKPILVAIVPRALTTRLLAKVAPLTAFAFLARTRRALAVLVKEEISMFQYVGTSDVV